MNWATPNLEELLELIWHALEQAPLDLKSPLRTAVLGTVSADHSSLRTVVLRKADRGQRALICYSDYRAAKISQIQINPRVCWLFYRPDECVQILAHGLAIIHHANQTARDAWHQTPLEHRLNYSSPQTPGTELGPIGPTECVDWRAHPPTPLELEHAFANFAVISASVDSLEFLKLSPAGHRRARFSWDGTRFDATWLSP